MKYLTQIPRGIMQKIGISLLLTVILLPVIFTGTGGLFAASPPETAVVEWTFFEAKPNGKDVTIRWGAVESKKHSHFVLERKTPETGWRTLAEVDQPVQKIGNVQEYGYTDLAVFSGFNIYRLKQVDGNGSFSYSQMVEVLVADKPVRVFPNPGQGALFVTYLEAGLVISRVEILDVSGRVVQVQSFDSLSESIGISKLTKGMYYLRFYREEGGFELIPFRKTL